MSPLRFRKELGQHFLRARWVINEFKRKVCGAGRVLEIGVGMGALTREICCCVSELVGLEVDRRLLPSLQVLSYSPSAIMVLSDALSPPVELSRFDVIYGSIPYSITGPLLSLLVKEYQGPAVLLLQREVGVRLVSKPGTSGYGRITVLVNMVYEVRLGPVVPPSAFEPPPRVYSCIVELIPKVSVDRELVERVEKLTACLFAHRNKLASKVVRKCVGVDVPLTPGKRVRDLTVEEIVTLARIAEARPSSAGGGGSIA